MDQLAATWITHFSYPAVLLLLILTGIGAPLSEEMVIVLGGMVVGKAHGSPLVMAIVAYLGQVSGDLLIFEIGRRMGLPALKKFKKILTPHRVEWIESHFRKRGALTIALARFLPGLRAPTYLLAGMGSLRLKTFAIADASAGLITAPILTWVGFHFGAHVLSHVQGASQWVLGLVGIALGVSLTFKVTKRRRRLKRGIADEAAREAVASLA